MNLSKLAEQHPDCSVTIQCENIEEKIQLMHICNNTMKNDWSDVQHYADNYPDDLFVELTFEDGEYFSSGHHDSLIENDYLYSFKELLQLLQGDSSPIINDDYELI